MNDNILNGNVEMLKEILAKCEEHEKTAGDIELLMSKTGGLTRELDALDRKTRERIDSAVKKCKDELVTGIDKTISKEADKLKKARADREKALARGKAQRMKDETEMLRKDNERLKSELKGIMREKRILPFCKSRLFLALFATKGIVEIIIFIFSFLVAACILPYLVFLILPSDKPLVLAVIYSVFWTVISFVYLFINNRVKINKWDVFKSIRLYKFKIEQNNRHIHKIKKEISSDSDEGAYDLNEFNARIGESERALEGHNKDKANALFEFENVTKPEIAARIETPLKDERERLVNELEAVKKELSDKEAKEKELRACLEKFVGSNGLDGQLMSREAISALIKIIEEGNAASIEEAACFYSKSNKK